MPLTIIAKGQTPEGISIQIECWDGNYKIGLYPKAHRDVYRRGWSEFCPPYPQRGKIFRASFQFSDIEETYNVFKAIVSGEKTYLNYLNNYEEGPIRKEDFLYAVRI